MNDVELFELVKKVDPRAVRLPPGIKAIAAEIEAKRDAEVAELTRKLAEQQAVFDRMAKTIGGNGIYAAEKTELNALLAKERERCASTADRFYQHMRQYVTNVPDIGKAIRSLK